MGMQGEKTVPRKKYAVTFVIVGVVLAILGVIFNFALDAKKTFDLPWFVLGIGVIAIVYGIVQMTRGQRLHPEVSFSARSAKNFLTNNAIMLALLALGVKNIHLGPTLPAFLSPNVKNVLIEQFGIGGISTADEDIMKFLS